MSEHRPPDCPRMNAACERAQQMSVDVNIRNQARNPWEYEKFGEAGRLSVILEEAHKLERELNALKANDPKPE